MPRRCPECDYNLSDHPGSIAVHGGRITSMGSSLYVDGSVPCPECGYTMEYEAKMCGGYPQ